MFHWKKAHNNARQPDTAKLRWKNLSVLDPMFGCFKLDFPQTDIACLSSASEVSKLFCPTTTQAIT